MKRCIKCIMAMVSVVLVLCTSFALPASASAVNRKDAYRIFPRLEGETMAQYYAVEVYIGNERYHEGTSINWTSQGVVEAYQHSVLQWTEVTDSSLEDVLNFPEDSNTWVSVASNTIQASILPTQILGTFFFNGADMAGSSYGSYFAYLFDEAYYSDSSLYEYSLNGDRPFAIRWSITGVYNSGETQTRQYVYIAFPTAGSEDNKDQTCHPIYIGTNHPQQCIYLGQVMEEAEWLSEKEALESEHAEELEAAKADAYSEGYSAGVTASSGGISIDTSDPVNVVLGFFSVLFKGCRDFITPFLSIEFSGVSLLAIIGTIGLILFVGLVIFFIVKIKG